MNRYYLTAKYSHTKYITVSAPTETEAHDKIRVLIGEKNYKLAKYGGLKSYPYYEMKYRMEDTEYAIHFSEDPSDYAVHLYTRNLTDRDVKLMSLLAPLHFYKVNAAIFEDRYVYKNQRHIRQVALMFEVAASDEERARQIVAIRMRQKVYDIEVELSDELHDPEIIVAGKEGFITSYNEVSEYMKDCRTFGWKTYILKYDH